MRKLFISDSKNQKKLNNLIHPLVLERLDYYKHLNKERKVDIFIVEIPLFYDVGFKFKTDKIITVFCDKIEQKKRLLKRDWIDKKLMNHMLDIQMSLDEKVQKCDFMIYSPVSKIFLKEQFEYIKNYKLKK